MGPICVVLLPLSYFSLSLSSPTFFLFLSLSLFFLSFFLYLVLCLVLSFFLSLVQPSFAATIKARPDASSSSFSSSVKHIWLRAIGGFGFLIHSDFLVEVVVVLRVVGGGCGFLGLLLVVVELGLKSSKKKKRNAGSNHILLCSVSGWVHYFGKK